jgi:hypothetical protein
MTENENFTSEFYDIVINIDSFNNLKFDKRGWEIEMNEKGLDNYTKYTKNEKVMNKLNRVGILGISGVGKTFILGSIIDKKELKKSHFQTKGISVIYPQDEGKNFVCIDSQGSEEPIIDLSENNEMREMKEKERKKKVKEYAADKKLTEIFIQDFIIKHSNIFIVVVDQLSFSEQKLINRLRNENYEQIFIIHNTQYLTDIKSIEAHIEETVKKSVFSNLKKNIFTTLEVKNEEYKTKKPYYFREKNIGSKSYDDNQKQIIHLFMGKEGSEAGKFYNQTTIDFLISQINQAAQKKKFDVIEEIKKFLSYMSVKYMINNESKESKEKPINLSDFSTDNTCIKLNENKDFKLKDCIIDEMGNSKFSENTITPAFVAYLGKYIKYKKDKEKKKTKDKEIEVQWDALIIKAEMFVDPHKIKIDIQMAEDKKSCFIIISCPKDYNKNDDITDIQEIDGTIKDGEIKINVECKLEKIKFEDLKKFEIKCPQKGIIMIYVKVSNVAPNQESNIKVEKSESKKIKETK